MCKDRSSFIGGVLFGALMGAAIGILTAPTSGKDTREKIKNRSMELDEEIHEIAENIQAAVKDVVDETAGTISKAKKRTFKGV